MKLLLLLTLLVGLAVALEFAELEDRQYKHRSHKKTSRPKKFSGATTMRASRKPSGAPPEYKTSTDKPSRKRSKATLKKLPSDLIDADLRRREESHRTLTLLRRQASVADYYECGSTGPADADCQTVIDQVYASNETLVVNSGACLTFSYKSCEGFFCALCETLATTTDFVGNQLDSAEALCVSNGNSGTLVGEDAPQWDAGFVNVGDGLPTYDVC